MFERASFTLFIHIVVIAAVAASVGSLLAIPLSEMFIAAALVIVLHKKRLLSIRVPNGLLLTVQIVLGISVGATISLSQLGETLTLPVIIGLVCCLSLQIASSFLWLRKREGWSPFESLLGAVPGAMAAILVISESSQTPSTKVVYSHSVRLMILTLLALFISNSTPDVAPVESSLTIYAWLIFFALALLSLLLGILIGARLADTTLREAMAYSRAGVMVTLIGLLVAVAVSGLFALLLDKSWVVLLLAWVPGSVEAMTAVALLLGMEPAFVMINHALRLLLLYSLPAVLKKPLEALRSK